MTVQRRFRHLVPLTAAAAFAVSLLPASGAGAQERAPTAAVVAAFEHALDTFSDPTKLRISFTLRSRMDRSWSLVTGQYGERRIWASWVRRTDGRQHSVIFRTRDFDPGPRPPCDIRPAFSEPLC